MIILEGTPGAGKTSLISQLQVLGGAQVVSFPEAQPPAGATDHDTVDALLREDLRRTAVASRLPASVTVLSDRCHLGVLAYRMALVATGRAPRSDLDYALAKVEYLGLWHAHRYDEFIITLIEPSESLRRRGAYRHDPRYRLWFEPDYLLAYNTAMQDLAHTHPDMKITTTDGSVETAAQVSHLSGIRISRSATGSSPQ